MNEHAVSAVAHEKRDGLVHALVLNAVGVVRPEHDFLAALVEAGEGFAAAENLFAGREREHRVQAPRIIRRAPHKRKRHDGRERAGVVGVVIRAGEQLALRVAEFEAPGIFKNGDRAGRARVAVAAVDLAVFPGMVLRHRAGQHQLLQIFMHLRAAGQADAHRSRRNKFDGERQGRVDRVLILGKFIQAGRLDDRQHVVERLAGEIFGALISDFARAGGRIEIGEFVRQIIQVGEIPEVAADIHRIVQQGQGGIGRGQPVHRAQGKARAKAGDHHLIWFMFHDLNHWFTINFEMPSPVPGKETGES